MVKQAFVEMANLSAKAAANNFVVSMKLATTDSSYSAGKLVAGDLAWWRKGEQLVACIGSHKPLKALKDARAAKIDFAWYRSDCEYALVSRLGYGGRGISVSGLAISTAQGLVTCVAAIEELMVRSCSASFQSLLSQPTCQALPSAGAVDICMAWHQQLHRRHWLSARL